MDELVQKVMQQAAAARKQPDEIPWKPEEPYQQKVYCWSEDQNAWQPVSKADPTTPSSGINSLALYSWNIDFMLPFPKERMDAALAHLDEQTAKLFSETSTAAVVIFIQECIPSDLEAIGQKKWIRDRFYVTDIDNSAWASRAYGTTTLVDRRLGISSCYRVHFSKTRMERDGLFVDVSFPTTPGKKLRLCNTHLESLALDPPFRPPQMQNIAAQMHADGISGAVVAGDFNAIQPPDLSLHTDNNLKDAYLELGGQENSEEGYTWGQQALPELRQRFGCSRMDKVFFCGDDLKLQGFKRFGADVEMDEAEKEGRNQLLAFGFEKAWVTDHCKRNKNAQYINTGSYLAPIA